MVPVESGGLSRSDRARRTRGRMLEAAQELFVTQGYAATTMERIAEEARVAVQTLYYSFRTKGQLLCEVVEMAAAGDDTAGAGPERAWMQQLLSATTGQRILALGVEHGADIFVRAARLWPVVAAAAGDPNVDQYWRDVAAKRRAGQGRMVARLVDLGALRDGLDPVRATDLVVTLFGHDAFRSLVGEAGWSVTEYKAWLFTTLVQQLLRRPRLTSASFSDLSYGPELRQT